jgi:hypothetical protein
MIITHCIAYLQVQRWLSQQAGADDRETGATIGASRPGKRKRSNKLAEINPRSQPRPRLQDKRSISHLQQINITPSSQRKTLAEICQTHKLDCQQLLRDVERSPALSSLPIAVDEYTQIDTWHSLRVHLPSNLSNPKAKMQYIRSKPASSNQAAKNDPVLFVTSSDTLASSAKLHGTYIFGLIFYNYPVSKASPNFDRS